MTHAALVAGLLVAAACAGSEGRVADGDAPARAAPPAGAAEEVVVEYLANEGVLVTSGGAAVVLDGLFGSGLPEYPAVAPSVRDSLEAALGRFAEIRAILVTHVHRDHFDAVAVARHLAANPGARLVAPAQAVDSLRAKAGVPEAVAERVHVLRLAPGDTARLSLAGIELVAAGLVHPPSRNQPVELVGYRVELGGAAIGHIGDASPEPDELAPLGRLDLLLAPWWVVTGESGARRIAAARPGRVAAFHLARDDTAAEVRARLSPGLEAEILERPGARLTLE